MNSAAPLPRALHLAPLYSTVHPPSMPIAPQSEAIDQGKYRPPAENAATTDEPSSLHSAPPGRWRRRSAALGAGGRDQGRRDLHGVGGELGRTLGQQQALDRERAP